MIWVRKTKDEYGNYIDASNTHYVIEWCHKLITPDGSTEEDHGYERFDDEEAACKAWGLVPYIDPESSIETENL